MKFTLAIAALPLAVNAFPAAFEPAMIDEAARIARRQGLDKDPLGISKAQTNCGPTPCTTFNAEKQFVSATGNHAYQSPSITDIRGPCPGLNAASNHNYLPRNGISTIGEAVEGLSAMYGLNKEITAFLAAYAVAVDGNVLSGTWSIGGPLPQSPLGGIVGTGQGLSYSHNNYEGDSSIGRNDAYINNGDAHSLNITKFTRVYMVGGKEDRYTLDKFRQRLQSVQEESIATNPYYFTGLFSTVVVVPAAYNFVINLMSNHSEQEPSGYLDGYNFKKFFAVTGKPGSFKWQKGQERLPENWYRRPLANSYTGADIGEDVGIGYAAYPKTLRFGGNTGKVNTFTGLSVSDVTGGALNATTLFQGDNFACFAFQLAQNGLPAFLKGPLAQVNKAKSLVSTALGPVLKGLNCPELGKMDQGLFNSFPGRHYAPKGQANNY